MVAACAVLLFSGSSRCAQAPADRMVTPWRGNIVVVSDSCGGVNSLT